VSGDSVRRAIDAVTFGPARRRADMRRRLAALDRLDTDPYAPRPIRPARRPGPGVGERLRTVLVLAAAVVCVVGWLAWESGSGLTPGGAPDSSVTSRDDLPPVPGDAADRPLGVPPATPAGSGGFRFLHTQEGGGGPVAYDPCRPIHYVVRPEGAPAGGEELLRAAIERVSAATGLRFVSDGTTSEAPAANRQPVQRDRYGDRWAPVLVSWSSPTETPNLAGAAIGEGGSAFVGTGGPGSMRYTTGTVTLDGPQFAALVARAGGRAVALAVIQHEFGHLVGLDHVDDPDQLMYPETTLQVHDFGAGDRRGLVQLGKGRCFGDT
jgi:hypothetical protein